MCNLRIRDLREDHDLRQTDIADLLHTTKQQYSKYERFEHELPIRHLNTLADYYNVSVDYILGKTNDPTPPKERKEEPPKKEYSPTVIKAAEEICGIIRAKKGREPNEQDLQAVIDYIKISLNIADKII